MKITQTESQLQEQVAQYLRSKYPDVLFHSDFGSGVKLTPGQAVRQKKQNGGRRAWPDLFIAEPVINTDLIGGRERVGVLNAPVDWNVGVYLNSRIWFGLFIELKREGTRLTKKNGEWASQHIKEQAGVLQKLRHRGYVAEFAVGFDDAKKMIDDYLGGANE